MKLIDFIIVFVVFILIASIIFFSIKGHKKNGACGNCPYAKNCSIKNSNKECKNKETNNNINKKD